jgi:hypothetical protein
MVIATLIHANLNVAHILFVVAVLLSLIMAVIGRVAPVWPYFWSLLAVILGFVAAGLIFML